jgi:hypothetical protein
MGIVLLLKFSFEITGFPLSISNFFLASPAILPPVLAAALFSVNP